MKKWKITDYVIVLFIAFWITTIVYLSLKYGV
jgi:hypothetical protein